MYKFQDQLKAVEGVTGAGLRVHKESFIYSVMLPKTNRLVGFIPVNGEVCFQDYKDPELAPHQNEIKKMLGLDAKI